MRLIDADALAVHKAYCVDEAGFGATFYVVDKSDIDNAPTIDAVPVVRCEDCIHYDFGVCLKIYSDGDVSTYAWQERKETDFCSYGERRSDD